MLTSFKGQQIVLRILINPGGYSRTSVMIRDAHRVGRPVIEVHLSNLAKRRSISTNHRRLAPWGSSKWSRQVWISNWIDWSCRPDQWRTLRRDSNNEFRKNLKIEYEGSLWVIVECQFVKPVKAWHSLRQKEEHVGRKN